MSKPEKKWLMTRIAGSRAHAYRTIQARTPEAAIRKIVQEYQIDDPEHLKHLAARPVA
jgi:hypothetical protein